MYYIIIYIYILCQYPVASYTLALNKYNNVKTVYNLILHLKHEYILYIYSLSLFILFFSFTFLYSPRFRLMVLMVYSFYSANIHMYHLFEVMLYLVSKQRHQFYIRWKKLSYFILSMCYYSNITSALRTFRRGETNILLLLLLLFNVQALNRGLFLLYFPIVTYLFWGNHYL